MNNHSKKKNRGFGLIEVILVIGVGMITFLGIEQYLNLSLKAAKQDVFQTEAFYWMRSNLETARVIRDEDWALISGLTLGSQYSFTTSGANPQKIISQIGTKIEGRYTTWITISQVQRDGNDNIASAGTVDPDTLKINSFVSWSDNGLSKQVSASEYLANF